MSDQPNTDEVVVVAVDKTKEKNSKANVQITKRVMESKEGFQWIDITGSSTTADEHKLFMNQLAEEYKLHPANVKDAVAAGILPKLEHVDDSIFIITRYHDLTASDTTDTVSSLTNKIVLFISKTFVISIHREDSAKIAHLRNEWDEINKDMTLAHLLNILLDKILETYEEGLESSSNKIDEFERKIFENHAGIVEQLYRIKRRASVFIRMLSLTKDIISKYAKITNEKQAEPDPYITDLLELTSSTYVLAEELHENAANLLNLHISLASHRTNELMTVLTVFSVFFIPITFLAGVYGMNFDFMPELHWKGSYPTLIAVMAIITTCIYLWFRKKGLL